MSGKGAERDENGRSIVQARALWQRMRDTSSPHEMNRIAHEAATSNLGARDRSILQAEFAKRCAELGFYRPRQERRWGR